MLRTTIMLLDTVLMEHLEEYGEEFTTKMVNVSDFLKNDTNKSGDVDYIQKTSLLLSMLALSVVKIGMINTLKHANPSISEPIKKFIQKIENDFIASDPMGFSGKVNYFEFFDTLVKFIEKRSSDAENRVLEIDDEILGLIENSGDDFDTTCKTLAAMMEGVGSVRIKKDILNDEDKVRIVALGRALKEFLKNLKNGLDIEDLD